MRVSAPLLLLALAWPHAATASSTILDRRYDVNVPSTQTVVNWGATCAYVAPANAPALEFDLQIRPELLPALAAGYDWGTTCTLKDLEFLVVPNGTRTLAERRAALPPLTEVGCDETLSKSECRRLLPVFIICTAYMFYMMALTCDEFLVPSLNVLCERTGIPDDVAGATIMAAGCNAPELFSVIVSTFIAPSTVGPGAILGSAPFNLMMIIAAASFAIGGMSPDPWLMCREIVSLAIATSALVFVMRDNLVLWWEALLMVVLYVGYVLLCVYTQALLRYFRGTVPTAVQTTDVIAPADDARAAEHADGHAGEPPLDPAIGLELQRLHGPRRSSRALFATSAGDPTIAADAFRRLDNGEGGGEHLMRPHAHSVDETDLAMRLAQAKQQREGGVQADVLHRSRRTTVPATDRRTLTELQMTHGDGAPPPPSDARAAAAPPPPPPAAEPSEAALSAHEIEVLSEDPTDPWDRQVREARARIAKARARKLEVRDSEASGHVRLSGVLLKQSRLFTRKTGVHGREWAQRFFELSDSESTPMRYIHLGADGEPLADGWTSVDLRSCRAVELARVVELDGTATSEIRLKPAHGRAWMLRCPPQVDARVGQRWADEILVRIDELRRADARDDAHGDGAHDDADAAHAHAHAWYAVGPGVVGKVVWVLTVWVKGILFYTVPNPLDPKLTKYYLVALGISAGWLAAQAYVMTLCLNYLGCALGISQIVMGNTIGAIGTSFPNLVASVITARQGFSGMSACQAIGSNTFNILIALGVVWFIQALGGQCQYGARSKVKAGCNGCFMPVGFDISCPRVPGAPFVGTPGSILGSSFVVYTNLALLTVALVINRGKFTKASCYVFVAYYALWFAYQFAASFGGVKTICILGDICI